MTKTILLITGLALAGIGCTGEAADGADRCDDPKYGDGTCDVQTSCSAPDVDCFTTFQSAEEARTWYQGSPFVADKGDAVSTADPRFAPMQALLDRGWKAYQDSHEVGDLADQRVQLVLVDNDFPNAFVAPSAGKAALAVMVDTGLIDLHAPDEQLMGIVMHELEHAIGLHVVPGVKDRFVRYYLAPAGSEPLGASQTDDATIRKAAEDWLSLSDDVGFLTDVELAGLPLSGDLGSIFAKTVVMQAMAKPTACKPNAMALDNLLASIQQRTSLLDKGVTLSGTNAGQVITQVLGDLQAQCFAGFTQDALAVFAKIHGVDEAAVRAAAPAELRALIEGKHFIQGIYNWVAYDRMKMRDIEAAFATQHGQPWARLRFFSTEEAADDSSVATLARMGLPADGIGRILPRLVEGLEAQCRPLVDGNQAIPYGEDLTDAHHGTCWRAGHAKARAAAVPRRAAVRGLVLAPAGRPRSPFAPPDPLWMD